MEDNFGGITSDGLLLGTINHKGLNPITELDADIFWEVRLKLSVEEFKLAMDRYKPSTVFDMFDEDTSW